MGRKKIQISRITDERNRQVTFNKRKFGVMKKAYELSVLCDCEIALIIFSSSNKLYQYASTDMDKVLLKYTEYNEPHESLTNKNIIEKEHKGAMSPESPEPDAIEYNLTPRTEAKYTKIDEEFQMMMQRHQHNGSRTMGQSNYTLPVSVPVNSYGESLLGSSPQMAHTSISPRPSSSETDSVYPPGGMLEMSNGYPPSASPLGGSPSPGPSPALGVGGGSANKGSNPSRHSPQPPPPPPPPHPHRSNLRVVIPTVTPLAQPLSEDTNYDNAHTQSALNAPVVALQTPTVPAGYSSFGPTDYSSDLGGLAWPTHQRYVVDELYSAATMSSISGLPHLAVSSSTPPPSTSPLPVKIKSEPISPPRDPHGGNSGSNGGPSNASNLHHTSLNVGPSSSTGPPPHHVSHPGPQTLNLVSSRPSSNPPPSHSGSITPTNLPSPGSGTVGDIRTNHSSGGGNGGNSSDYENGPLMKRSRITEVLSSKRNNRNKKSVSQPRAPPRTVDASNTSGLDPEAEDRFELELCWCIQQLEASLTTGKLQERQMQELGKQLQSLKSNTAPLIKKRQIMRNTLGDYREKMAEDERKFSKSMSAVKFTSSASSNKKSIFIKKAMGHNTQDLNKQTNELQNILQDTKQTVSDSNRTETPFQFNFQTCQ